MLRGLRLSRAGAWLPVALLLGCSGDDAEEIDLRFLLNQTCESDAECKSGMCEPIGGRGRCTVACESDADCDLGPGFVSGQTVCGIGADGTRMCMDRCPSSGVACVDGVPTACERLSDDETYCETCGCPSELECHPGVGCMPLQDVGGPCTRDDHCRTGNCSIALGLCRVPVGSACTTADCDACITSASAGSFCSRACGSDSQCNGAICIGNNEIDAFTCQRKCATFGDTSCPGRCRQLSNVPKLFCECEDCTTQHAPRPSLAPCTSDAQCSDGRCLGPLECAFASGACVTHGNCTQPCSSNADCGDKGACIELACIGASTDCGRVCIPRCDGASRCAIERECRMIETIDGAQVSVCDPRLGTNKPCETHQDCRSLSCTNGRCTAAPGSQPLGGACAGNGDCQGGRCISGTCRGTALIGDPCSIPADCAAGTCRNGTCG